MKKRSKLLNLCKETNEEKNTKVLNIQKSLVFHVFSRVLVKRNPTSVQELYERGGGEAA